MKCLTKKGLSRKEIKSIYNKRYYKKLKESDKIVKINCNCGGRYGIYTKSSHFSTLKHKKFLKSLDL